MARAIASDIDGANEFAFTEPKIDALIKAATRKEVRLDADGRRWWRDTECRQLWVRVSSAGGAAYYRVFKSGGKRIKQHVGDANLMLLSAARAHVDRLRNGDVQSVRKRAVAGSWTIREAVDAYLDASRNRTFKVGRDFPAEPTIRSYFEVARPHLLRGHGGQSLQWLADNFARIHAEIARTRPGAADRLRTVVTNVYTFAIERGQWSGVSPLIDWRTGRKTTRPAGIKARERFLSLDEIAALEMYARQECDPWRDFWLLALATGVRRGNLRDARWQDIDLTGRVWRLPKTKNGRQHVVPLTDRAMELLTNRRHRAEKNDKGGLRSPWLFPRKGYPDEPIRQTRDAWQRLREAVPSLKDARTHDLRRTVGAQATIAGIPEAVVGAMLGHTPGSVATKVYARINVAATQAGFSKVAEALDKALPAKPKRRPK
jgi:integrase